MRIGISFLLILFLCLACVMPPAADATEMDVKKDDQKITYTVGPSDRGRNEEAKDKERAWEMLRNTNIIMDRRAPQTQQAPAPPAR